MVDPLETLQRVTRLSLPVNIFAGVVQLFYGTTMTTNQSAIPMDVALEKPAASPALLMKLSIMMFLQDAIWGAWLPVLFQFFNEYRNFSASEIGNMAALGALGAMLRRRGGLMQGIFRC